MEPLSPLQKANLEEISLSGISAPASDKIIQRKLAFELPFIINIEDNFGHGLLQSYYTSSLSDRYILSKKPEITFDFTPAHNFPNQTPLDCPPPYVINSKYGIIRLTFLRVNNLIKYEDPHSALTLDTEFMGSISKSLNFTCVLAELSESTFDIRFDDRTAIINLADEVINAFNTFLGYYKIISNRLYIPSVTVHTVGNFTLMDLFEDQGYSTYQIIRHWEQPIPFSKSLPSDLENSIRKMCLENTQVDLNKILLHEAWNKIVLREWRLAVINSVILFESWLTPFLEDAYRLQGVTDGDIKAKFKTKEAKSRDRKHLGIAEIIQTLVLDAIKYDFKNTNEYDDVFNKSILLRNSIIHKSKLDVTPIQARECIHAVLKAIDAITKARLIFEGSRSTVKAINVFDVSPR